MFNQYDHWMSFILGKIDKVPVFQIPMPATHNSGAIEDVFPNTKCQDQSIYYQLMGGVRAFDLRVTKWQGPGDNKLQYYIHHGWFTMPLKLSTVLDQVIEFTNGARHEYELIILYVGPGSGSNITSTEDKMALRYYVSQTLGPKLVPWVQNYNESAWVTYQKYTPEFIRKQSADGTVIVLGDGGTDEGLWPSNDRWGVALWDSSWNDFNATDPEKLLQLIGHSILSAAKERFQSLKNQSVPAYFKWYSCQFPLADLNNARAYSNPYVVKNWIPGIAYDYGNGPAGPEALGQFGVDFYEHVDGYVDKSPICQEIIQLIDSAF